MKYGDDELGRVQATRGKIHNYLGITLDYSISKKLKLKLKDYIEKMIKEFPETLKESNCPWNENVFKVNEEAEKIIKSKVGNTSKVCCIRIICKSKSKAGHF
jgi:mRNA-degrading endonuclease RelE of RelBE toxin-antitoxin system